MTFLLFLASLAVMEFLLRKPRKKPDDDPKTAASDRDRVQGAVSTAISMPSLLALGQALQAQGRGAVPGVAQAPQVHGPPVDGV